MRTLLLASLILTSACGTTDGPDPVGADPEVSAPHGMEAPVDGGGCRGVTVDLQSDATPSPFDGTWVFGSGSFDGVMEHSCTEVEAGSYHRYYLSIHEGSYEVYDRVYSSVADCVFAGFDSGGTVEVRESGAVKMCPETYPNPADRQLLFVASLPDGSLWNSYQYFRIAPDGPSWKEMWIGAWTGTQPRDLDTYDQWNGGFYRRPL